jgi:hypothetical protein
MPKGKRKIFIPQEVQTQLEKLATDKKQLLKFQRLVGYVLSRHLYKNIPISESIEISWKHFRKQIGWRSHDQLSVLLEKKILVKTRNHCNYANTENRCCSYQINPAFLQNSDLYLLEIEATKQEQRRNKIERKTEAILKKLMLPCGRRNYVKALNKYRRDSTSKSEILAACKVNSAIPEGHYKIGYVNPYQKRRFKKHVSLEVLLKRAATEGKDVILYRDKCYIESLEYFVSVKTYCLRFSYSNSLLGIININEKEGTYLYCKRNSTNNRLDTNVTNIKTCAISLFTIEGQRLTNIDLSNSQFTILGRILEVVSEASQQEQFNGSRSSDKGNRFLKVLQKFPNYLNALRTSITLCSDQNAVVSNDLSAFIYETKVGRFYEYYSSLIFDQYTDRTPCISFERLEAIKARDPSANDLYTVIRAAAKKTMFQTLFSSHKYNPASKVILKKHFPNLVKFCDSFKKEMIKFYSNELPKKQATKKGNAALAVMLQTIEAEIFIDTILFDLLKKGYKVLSKHDSILCKNSDTKEVQKVVETTLNSFFGPNEYELKIERPTAC